MMPSKHLPFDIVVLSTKHKAIKAKEWLEAGNYEYHLFVNEDWPYPAYPINAEKAKQLEPKQEIAYRIFRGHQEALKVGKKDLVLVLEDDAIPRKGWELTVLNGSLLIPEYEVVSFYGRAMSWKERVFVHQNETYVEVGTHPRHQLKWVNGAVAYLTSREIALRIAEDKYEGVPFDLHLPHNYKFCVIAEHCGGFEHSYQYGSHRDGNVKL